jgi:hypothetical protein
MENSVGEFEEELRETREVGSWEKETQVGASWEEMMEKYETNDEWKMREKEKKEKKEKKTRWNEKSDEKK